MTESKKKELIKLYFDLADKEFYYKSKEEYVKELIKLHNKYFSKDEAKNEQIKKWLLLLGSRNKKTIYLGVMLSLKENNMEILNNALYTATTLIELTQQKSEYDHSIYASTLLPILLSANRFKEIEKIFPKENGLSTNGYNVNVAITNLLMYLYYREDNWKEAVLKNGKHILDINSTKEDKAIISCLMSLIEKDFNKFSIELSNICKAKKKTKNYGENEFTKQFCFYALGLYNFAIYLYGNEMNDIELPDDDNFPINLALFQKENNYSSGESFIKFENPLELLNDLIEIDAPVVCLTNDGKKRYIDIDKYQEEIIKIMGEQKTT